VEAEAKIKTPKPSREPVDLGTVEHLGAMAAGAVFLALGLSRKGLAGGIARAGGLALIARGISGYAPLYRAVGLPVPNTLTGASHKAIRVESAVDINRSASDLYALWRDVENLPAFMSHLVSVQVIDPVRSRWTARGPGGTVVNWEAMIINDIKNELIAWETVEGSSVDHAGSVHFQSLEDGRARLRVVLRYDPPASKLGAVVARLIHGDPQSQIDDDLRRFQKMIDGLTKAEDKVKML
jgi:uncharacterized membrane protein